MTSFFQPQITNTGVYFTHMQGQTCRQFCTGNVLTDNAEEFEDGKGQRGQLKKKESRREKEPRQEFETVFFRST